MSAAGERRKEEEEEGEEGEEGEGEATKPRGRHRCGRWLLAAKCLQAANLLTTSYNIEYKRLQKYRGVASVWTRAGYFCRSSIVERTLPNSTDFVHGRVELKKRRKGTEKRARIERKRREEKDTRRAYVIVRPPCIIRKRPFRSPRRPVCTRSPSPLPLLHL